MAIAGIGASAYRTTQWPGQPIDWTANKPNGQNSTNPPDNAANGTTGNGSVFFPSNSTGANGTTGGTPAGNTLTTGAAPAAPGGTTSGAAVGATTPANTANSTNNATSNNNTDNNAPPLPPRQAATTPGTGQKIDIIA